MSALVHHRHVGRGLTGTAVLVVLALGACKDRTPDELPDPLEPEPIVAVAEADDPEPALTDLGITHAVERELLADHLTPAFEIGVATKEGVVELTGTVDNLLARTRATRIAEAVKGVRSVSNRLIVAAPEIADADLAADVEQALLFDPATESYEIAITIEDAEVTLEGAVSSWAEKQIAEQVVASVRGVEAIDNQLLVSYAHERDDAEIATEIEKLLARDVLIDEHRIEVAVADGHVTLSGTVGSAAERTAARARAWTAGVESVDVSALKIDWLARDPDLRERSFQLRTEAEIADAITDALRHDPRVFAFDVTPVVRGTTLTLRGTVDNLEAKHAAEQLARTTTGVAAVDNDIEVEPGVELGDEAVATAIRSRLQTNVYTDLHEIDVAVDNGIVTLSGTVDSYVEKAEATAMASHARGAVLIHNLLQVEHPEIGFYYDPYLYPYQPYVEHWPTYAPPAAAAGDEDIERAIEQELYWSPYIDEAHIEVFVRRGEATLTGTVDSWAEREAATRDAYEGGAVFVDNLLHVEP